MTSLACARCGAPLPADARRATTTCAYCGAANAPPPEVVEVERVVVVATEVERGGLACPRCARPLVHEEVGQVHLLGCEGCGGIFLDPPAVEYLSRVNDQDVVNAARRIVGVLAPRSRDLRPRVSCPVCKQAMRRIQTHGSDDSLDVCDAHGTWFDREEIAGFVAAYREEREGEVTEEDLAAAGVPGGKKIDGEGSFFTDLFRALQSR